MSSRLSRRVVSSAPLAFLRLASRSMSRGLRSSGPQTSPTPRSCDGPLWVRRRGHVLWQVSTTSDQKTSLICACLMAPDTAYPRGILWCRGADCSIHRSRGTDGSREGAPWYRGVSQGSHSMILAGRSPALASKAGSRKRHGTFYSRPIGTHPIRIRDSSLQDRDKPRSPPRTSFKNRSPREPPLGRSASLEFGELGLGSLCT